MQNQLIELTDEAIKKLLQKKTQEQFNYIRLGITGGGCAGFEYIFDSSNVQDPNDVVLDYGKFSFIVDQSSKEFIEGMTLDFVQEGLNKMFKFINPKAVASCGCGESVTFNV